jgi:hypothetical protein
MTFPLFLEKGRRGASIAMREKQSVQLAKCVHRIELLVNVGARLLYSFLAKCRLRRKQVNATIAEKR